MRHALKVGLFMLGSYTISHILSVHVGTARESLIHSTAFSFFAVVVGLLIAAVGIFLGSLGNLYALIASSEGISVGVRRKAIGLISKSVNQVKQDVFLTLSALATAIALQFLKYADLPCVKWPLVEGSMTKVVVYDALVIWLAIVSMAAIFDCVRVMFLLHQHYEEIAKARLNREPPPS